MNETTGAWEDFAGEWGGSSAGELADGQALGLELELGGLVAALSASTEDETELALRVRAIVECGRHRIRIGHRAAACALGN